MAPNELISAFGNSLTAEQWAKKSICKVSSDELVRRLRAGMSPREAITTPSVNAKRVSQYRGVTWHVRAGKWIAQIKVDGKPVYIGQFDDEIEAAKAFNEVARSLGRETNEI
jgi:hypothetical protein